MADYALDMRGSGTHTVLQENANRRLMQVHIRAGRWNENMSDTHKLNYYYEGLLTFQWVYRYDTAKAKAEAVVLRCVYGYFNIICI